MSKHYYKHDVVEEIRSAIELLCWNGNSCTPTEVLKLAKMNPSSELYSLTIQVAICSGYIVESAGRGYRIYDW